jgi:two-component system, chemotaxis family, chemotaxis protein CheY
VVDDDPDVRLSLADALEDEGYEVLTAQDGSAALDLLVLGRDPPPDLILLDMMMPRMDGWTFRSEQRKRPQIAAIPIIVFTAYGPISEISSQLDAAGALKKPVRLDELLDTVQRVGLGVAG